MKEYKLIFWRNNPQLKSGGYRTERTVRARNLNGAEKAAVKIQNSCLYGSFTLLSISCLS